MEILTVVSIQKNFDHRVIGVKLTLRSSEGLQIVIRKRLKFIDKKNREYLQNPKKFN